MQERNLAQPVSQLNFFTDQFGYFKAPKCELCYNGGVVCCGKLTVKSHRRFLTNKGNGEGVLFVLRHFYGKLMVEQRMRLENSEVHHQMLTELNNEFMTRAFLCEKYWKILSTFYKKETSIKQCF